MSKTKGVTLKAKRLNLPRSLNNTVNTALTNKKINRDEYMTYYEFIDSKSWELIKKAWYKRYGKVCVKCNSAENIQLHHIVYPVRNEENKGRYRKVLDKHFVAFCSDCHKQYHDENGVWRDMINSTVEFIGKSRYNKIFTIERIQANRKKKFKNKLSRKEKNNIRKRNKKIREEKKRTSLSASELLTS